MPHSPTLSPRRIKALTKSLSAWFLKNQRKMPWRESGDPYRIWLSEIMLQQTRVDTVVPYYEKFLNRFPDVHALAAAPQESVLAQWAGLGYYARARALHKAAKVVANELSGKFPEDAAGLRVLPGIGPYTAGAVASIAFDAPEPAVDGNVVRVLSRFLAWSADTASPKDRAAAAPLVREILRNGSPRTLTQALMELGATVCVPANPACPACPLSRTCEAKRQDAVEKFPKTVPRKRPVSLRLIALALYRPDGKVLLERPSEKGLFGGLWLFPLAECAGEGECLNALSALAKKVGAATPRNARAVGTARHTLTHRKLEVVLFAASPAKPPRAGRHLKWIDPTRPDGLALSTFQRKLLALAVKGINAQA